MRLARLIGPSCLAAFLVASVSAIVGCGPGGSTGATPGRVKDAPPDPSKGMMTSDQYYQDKGKRK